MTTTSTANRISNSRGPRGFLRAAIFAVGILSAALGLVSAPLRATVTYKTIAPTGAVNDSCQGVSGNNVVGDCTLNEGTNGNYMVIYLYDGSTYTIFTFPNCRGVSGNNVVGYIVDSNNVQHAYILYNGIYTTIDPPGTAETTSGGSRALGVSGNNVVGIYVGSSNVTHGFFYNGTTYTTIDPPGTTRTNCTGVSGNNVVGTYVDSSNVTHGFLYNGGSYTVIDPPGTSDTTSGGSQAIGGSGNNVVGTYVDNSNVTHGFLYNGGSYTVIDPPGTSDTTSGGSQAIGVSGNNVVGYYVDIGSVTHGFLYDGTTYTTIDPPGTTRTNCTGVSGNNVVGDYFDSSGVERGFLATVSATAPTAAKVTLSGLAQTYTDSPESVTATTIPSGLSVSITYSSSTYPSSSTAPTAVGTYAVVATITSAGYTGSAKGTLVISKGTATVTLGDLSATYNGSTHAATATTNPSGLTVSLTYNGSATAPTNVGSYKVVGTVSVLDYTGSATGTLTIAKAAASVTVGSQTGTYTGNALAATATTLPADLPLTFAYTLDGKAATPINAGTYDVTATINSPNAAGSNTGTLMIRPATATITLSHLTVVYTGKPILATATTKPAKLAVALTYNGSATAPASVGSYTVEATITNPNYTGSAMGALTITPVPPVVVTSAASSIRAATAEFSGTVNPEGSSAFVHFQYYPTGQSGGYSNSQVGTTSAETIDSGTAIVPFAASIASLTPATTYHYRGVAVNGVDSSLIAYGADKVFATLAVPVFNPNGSDTPLLSGSGAEVGFSVNPGGVATSVYFQYGTSTSYGDVTATIAIGSGKVPVDVEAFLPGLTGNVPYDYRIVTTGPAGTFYGPNETFTALRFEISLVPQTGGPAPGTNGTYATFDPPAINSSNGLAFGATLAADKSLGISATNGFGIWADDSSGTSQLIAQLTGYAPDTASATFAKLSDPVYNANLDVAFSGTLKVATGQATAATENGVWSNASGALHLVAREGDQAPDCPTGAVFKTFESVGLSNAGAIVLATLTGSSTAAGVTSANNTGIWEGTEESSLTLKLRSGASIGGKTLGTLTVPASLPGVGGQTRFFAYDNGDLSLLGTFTDKTTGIVKVIGGTASLPYVKGGSAPGITGGTFATFNAPIINDNDQVAFEATLTPASGIASTNDVGIFVENGSSALQLIARTGATAPGTGGTYATLDNPVYNDHQTVAFYATLKGATTGSAGLFSNGSGSVQGVAYIGQQAPGCPEDAKFSAFTQMALPNGGGSNDEGGLVFQATVSGGGVTSADNIGVWIIPGTGSLTCVVRTGDTLLPGKTVASLGILPFNAALAGQTRSFSSLGDLAILVTFTDKTQAILNVTPPGA
jgi:hypothetical protein